MIQCRKCISTPNTPVECIGQAERALRDRFGEHRRAIQNNTDDAIPQHFCQPENQLVSLAAVWGGALRDDTKNGCEGD